MIVRLSLLFLIIPITNCSLIPKKGGRVPAVDYHSEFVALESDHFEISCDIVSVQGIKDSDDPTSSTLGYRLPPWRFFKNRRMTLFSHDSLVAAVMFRNLYLGVQYKNGLDASYKLLDRSSDERILKMRPN